jgi:hypothetical protein
MEEKTCAPNTETVLFVIKNEASDETTPDGTNNEEMKNFKEEIIEKTIDQKNVAARLGGQH